MENKEKILRWDLQEAQKTLNSNLGECPLVSMAFAIMEARKNEVNQCQKELDDYLKNIKNGKRTS